MAGLSVCAWERRENLRRSRLGLIEQRTWPADVPHDAEDALRLSEIRQRQDLDELNRKGRVRALAVHALVVASLEVLNQAVPAEITDALDEVVGPSVWSAPGYSSGMPAHVFGYLIYSVLLRNFERELERSQNF